MIDESLPVVRKMLDYLYTGDYSELIDDSPTDILPNVQPLSISALQLHAQLFAVGDKYCIPELCDAARENIRTELWVTLTPLNI